MITRTLSTLVAGGLLCCQAQPVSDPPAAAAPISTSSASIPLGPVSGNILGKAFSTQHARYTVDRRPHYEKVEIQLFAGKLEHPCEDIAQRHDTTLWLRRSGVRLGDGDRSAWEAHYELFQEGAWLGVGDAEVALYLSEPAPDLKLPGELRACFPDRTRSCVTGSFLAVHCPIRIDALVRGTDSMERPPPRH